jgi:tetratricopeptide (TPR) repeat protein
MRKEASIVARLTLAGALLAAAGAPASAAGDDVSPVPSPPARPGDTLRIPGLPPIPLPPGSRVFGPHGPEAPTPPPRAQERPPAPGAQDAQKTPPAPHPDINVPETRTAFLDELFQRLRDSNDEAEARGIAGAIERVWARSGSDTADLLMGRALSAFRTKEYDLATQLLDKVVAIDPDWAEAWNKRATVRYFADDYAGAMESIAHTLKLEPRHFGALSGLGFILEKSGMDRRALEVFRKTLEIYPRLDDIRKLVDKLSVEIEGRDL